MLKYYYEDFESLYNVKKLSYVLVVNCGGDSLMNCLAWLMCEIGRKKHTYTYDSDSGPGQQLHSQSSTGDLAVVVGQRNGKFSQNST